MQRQLDKLLVLIDNKGFDAKVDNLIIFFLEYEVDFDVDYIPPTSPQYSSSSSSESEADDDLNFEQIENDDIQPLKMYYTRTPLVLYHNPKFRGAIAIINMVITLVDSINQHIDVSENHIPFVKNLKSFISTIDSVIEKKTRFMET